MEAEERQERRGRRAEAKQKITAAELERSVPDAPCLADFEDGAKTAVDEAVVITAVQDAVVTAAVKEMKDRTSVVETRGALAAASTQICEAVASRSEPVGKEAEERKGAEYGELSRGLRHMEPHFFLAQVRQRQLTHLPVL